MLADFLVPLRFANKALTHRHFLLVILFILYNLLVDFTDILFLPTNSSKMLADFLYFFQSANINLLLWLFIYKTNQ